MAIFDVFKKNKEDTPKAKKKTAVKKTVQKKVVKKKKDMVLTPGKARMDQGAKGGECLSSIIVRPRITEKASYLAADGVYTFDIDPRANKIQVKRAMEEIYNVTPVRVNIMVAKPKRVVVRGKRGVKKGGKKALVYLKEGDKIEFV